MIIGTFSFEHMAVLWFSLEPFLILLLRFEYGLWIALLLGVFPLGLFVYVHLLVITHVL
jgi:hypothetical protein